MPASTPSFTLSVSPDGALMVSGEVDMAVADDFLNAAVSLADPTREVVLDVAGLVFIDSAGLRAIWRLAKEACPHGLVIQSPRDNVLRVLEIIGFEDFGRIRVERREG